MANLKISSNLFIGSKELQKIKEFVDDEGFRKLLLQNTMSYGLLNNVSDGAWVNGRVEQGTNVGTIKHGSIFGIDNVGNFLVKAVEDNIAVVDDSAFYWVKATHVVRNYEIYDVDVDISGNLSAPNTDGNFTDILRGQPNIASRVEFFGAVSNTGEYDVQSVADDNNAILQGSFVAEVGLKMIVVGTFSPDANPSGGDKNVFNYDHVTISLELETVSETPPAFTADQEFYLARVSRTGATLTIEDKRRSYVYRDKADFQSQNIDRSANPLIGVEAVKYDDDFSTRDENILDVAWAFRSSNWTINSATNLVTINGGVGGKWKSTTPFVNGDLDGWRLYTEDGRYSIINSSSESGSQINLTLDTLDPANYSNASQQLIVCPNSDNITIHVISDQSLNNLVEVKETFPINTDIGRIKIVVYADPTASFLVKYSYGQGKEHDIWRDIPTDTDEGYLTEDSFDANGIQQATIRQTYTSHATNGYIIFQLNPNSFKKVVERVDLGDAIGVDYVTLDNGFPEKTIVVGVQKQMQVYQGAITLTGDHYISLETAGAVEGNAFVLKFENDTDLSNQSLQLVQDFVNPGSPGTLILDFGLPSAPSDFWLDRAAEGNMWLHCEFDGTDWVVMPIASVTQAVIDIVTGGSMLIDGSVVATGLQKYNADVTGLAGWPNDRAMPDKQFVDDSILALIDGAPATLDTLNELAAAINDDPNIGSKVTVNDGKVSNVTTNITIVEAPTNVDIQSSDGSNDTIAAANGTNAGVMTTTMYDEHVVNNGKVSDINHNATHTGDVTGSIGLTIGSLKVATGMVQNDAITYGKIQNVVSDERILGRVSGANGVVEELTATQVKTMLGVSSITDGSDSGTVQSTGTSNFTVVTVALDDEAVYKFDIWTVAIDDASTVVAKFSQHQTVTFTRDGGGGPVIVSTADTIAESEAGTGGSLGVVATISSNNILFQVSGDTGFTINWKMYVSWIKHV